MPRIVWFVLGAGLWACTESPSAADPVALSEMVEDEGVRDLGLYDFGLLPDGLAPPIEVVAIETRVNAAVTPAGTENRVTCTALDAQGEAVEGHALRADVRPIAGWRSDPEERKRLIGEIAGSYQITCVGDGLGLRDASPALWEVVPGPPDRAATVVEPPVMLAGESSLVECFAWDAFDNLVELPADVPVRTQPDSAGVTIADGTISATAAGRYAVNCDVLGATANSAPLAVLPGTPARIVAGLAPVQRLYAVGQVVTFAARVVDEFDNPIPDAPLAWDSVPPLPIFGDGRVRPVEQGRYRLGVNVENSDLRAEAELLVDAGGPAITCTNPGLGGMVAQGPLALQGRVTDLAGVARLTVDGEPVQPDAEGAFTVSVEADWGLNVHELVAVDTAGNVNSTLCIYFGGAYIPEDVLAADTIQLHLGQTAIDDGPGARPLRSIADLLRRVLNSPALITTAVSGIQNPVVPSACRARVPILGCVFRLGASFEGLSIDGARTIDIDLVDGGVRLRSRLEDIDVRMRLNGTLRNRGTINAAFIDIDVTFDVRLLNGRPDLRLRASDTQVGRLSANFSGFLTGWLLELVFRAFEGTIRREVAGALAGFVSSQADSVVQGVLSGLDLAALSVAANVPGIAGGPATPLSLDVGFTSLTVNGDRLLLGLGTDAKGPVRQAADSAGVAVPPGPRTIALDPAGNMGASINLVLVNQLLHRLWRAGVFTLADADQLIDGLPNGARFSIQVLTPPALLGTGDAGVRVHLGPAVVEVSYPGFFDEPLGVTLAAWIDADVDLLNGTDIAFNNVTVDGLALSVEDAGIPPEARDLLERELTRILQRVIDTVLAGALPSLPVPDFALPAALSDFGVPAGTRMGLRDMSLDGTAAHFTLSGTLAE